MDKISKSSIKSPTAKPNKRVKFKVQSDFPSISQTSEKLDLAIRTANELIKLETSIQQLLKDTKAFLSQYHAQCLTRFQVEKILEQNCIGDEKIESINMAQAKKKIYEDLIQQYLPAN